MRSKIPHSTAVLMSVWLSMTLKITDTQGKVHTSYSNCEKYLRNGNEYLNNANVGIVECSKEILTRDVQSTNQTTKIYLGVIKQCL